MEFSLSSILLLSSLAIFAFSMFFTNGEYNKTYIKFVLIVYPLMELSISTKIGSFALFDIISLFFFLFFYKKQHKIQIRGMHFNTYLILLLLVIAVGLINTSYFSLDSIRMLGHIFSSFVFLSTLLQVGLSDTSYFYTVRNYLVISLKIALVFLLIQIIVGVEFSFEESGNLNILSGNRIRYPGYFQDPQKFAQYLTVLSFIVLIKAKNQLSLGWANYLLLLATLIAMLLTGGRAAFGGWILGVGLVFILAPGAYKTSVLFAGIVMFIVAINYAEKIPMFNRESTLTDALDFRWEIWKDAYQIFLKHPLVGIGTGAYATYVSIHNPDQFWELNKEITYFDHPESGYLKFLTELGILGFLLLLILILMPIYKAVRLYLKNDDLVLVLLSASIMSWMVGFYTVYSLGDSRIWILVLTILSMLIIRIQKDTIHV
jgi:O-antigen ligase